MRLDLLVAEAVAGRGLARVGACDAGRRCRGEPDALRRALDNLLDNAEVHGPRGGEVTVSVTMSGGQPRRWPCATRAPGSPRPTSSTPSSASGARPDAADRPGSGLGLAIVRATAQRHGGRVTVDGSTIAIVLPASVAARAGDGGVMQR